MTPTKAMILAATRAEFDYYQKRRMIGPERFIPTPPDVIKVMLAAALELVERADAPVATRRKMVAAEEPVPVPRKSAIVEARKPRHRRR